MPSNETRRVFLAVDTSDEVKAAASARLAFFRLAFGDLRVSWVRPENLHVTLKFLGDSSDEQISGISERLAEAAVNFKGFCLSLSTPVAFGRRVLTTSITDASSSLGPANHAVESIAEEFGFPREKRNFKPHLTLARIRDEWGSSELISKHIAAKIEPVEWQVREIVLYESKLGSNGSTYSKLKTFPLNPAT